MVRQRESQSLPETLIQVLELRTAEQAQQTAYVFLETGDEEGSRLTYGELGRRARDLGALLQQAGLAGERALLLYPPGLEFVVAFWGCLYAGVVAVPAYPPRSARTLPRLRAIARDAQPAAVLTTAKIQAQVGAAATHFPEEAARWIATDARPAELGEDLSSAWRAPGLRGDSLAFLQYTSGSTAAPKGVKVSHANLLHNEEMIRRAFRQSERSVVAGWLPLYHDMGLIGNVLQPLYAGATCVLLSPVAFLQRPRRWLEAITRCRATTSGGPNFAYDLCVRKVGPADREGLDLSTWEVAFNGAEPVRAETLERFAAAFAPCGFRKSAFYPCYGLAEATLFAAGGPGGEAPVLRVRTADLERHRAVPLAPEDWEEDGRTLVGCGGAWLDQRLAIADPESGAPLPEGQVGEIWLAGPSVAGGYWGRPEETARTFGARLAGGSGSGPWLRTGDLGFVAGGDLYVTGRIKDLIILRGRNHYPQDIELTVEACHPALRPGCGAAFAVEAAGEERLVVAQELDRRAGLSPAELQAVGDAVRGAVSEQHEVQVHEVVLLAHGSIPQTSSGKIQRHACRAAYLDGTLEVLARSTVDGGPADPAPSSEDQAPAARSRPGRDLLLALPAAARAAALGRHLGERLAGALGLPAGQLDPARPLTAYGLDSLAAVELQGALAEELGVEVPLAALLEGETLDGLTAHLLAGLGADASSPAGEAAPAPAAEGPAEGDFPLSAGQQALWFLDRLAPESAAYHIAAAARLHGALNPALLAGAFGALARRHPALRTAFEAPGGTPRQRVHAQLDPEVLIADAADLDEAELGERLAAAAFRPFDLAAGPLLRVGIFRRGPQEHLLLLAVHHLVADFASLAALVADLGRLAAGGDLPAPPAVRFTDWVRWQAAQLAGERAARLTTAWQERLAGLPDLELPTDRPRPPVQTFRGGSAAGWLDAEESARIAARAGDGTLFALLLAAFQTLLARLSGQDDFAVGSPVSLRRSEALREVVGYLVNPVVLRADLAGDPPFGELLERAWRRAVEALEARDLPFPWLAERLRPARDPGRPPLFQAMLSFERAARPDDRPLAAFALGEAGARAELGPWRLESLALPGRPAAFDLTLVAAELDGRLGFSLQFNADLFDKATAARTLTGFQALLAAAAADPARRLSALPLLTAAEQAQLAAWNATLAEIPAVALHELIAAQALLTPEAPAVEHEGQVMSYAELDGRAVLLAGRLARRGAGPGALVGLLVGRSANMVVALLGILRTGAAYVPLDPAFPAERLAWMVEDAGRAQAGPMLVVTQSALLGAVPPGVAADALLLLDDEEAGEPAPLAAGGTVGALDLAYVVYTSGSTGRPKGVAVPHGPVVNFLRSMALRPALAAADTLLAVTTLSFDIAGLEIYLPLTVGAKVAVASRATATDGGLLAAALERTGATCLQATPATWRLLLAAGWRGRPGLKMLCGGESLPRELAERLLPLGAELWNVYGPTETTIWSTVHRVEPGAGPVAIGGPIANTAVHVVGRHGEPVPIGVPGELWIGGTGVARGYLNRPDLTAERFVPDPFSTEPGARAYRTGDLGSRRPDGLLECLGRVDHQVKVRGYRIELQEIEARLARHPAVAQAVAVARGEGEERRLVGYVVPRFEDEGSAPPAPGELRAFLAAALPDYMVPTAWVFLDGLPLTPNGKVDRKALPAPEATRSAPVPAAPPGSETERSVAAVWQEVLGLPAVGRDESFFDLGGHSLLLARVQTLLRERLGADLTLVDLFRFPTVRSLAAHLAGGAEAAPVPAAASALVETSEIAVIGLAGRFPGAADAGRFWQNLRAGVESIATFGEEELLAAGVDRATLADPAYVRAGGVLDDVECFDAPFFGFNPREAEVMDPQHRIFLECAWEALEDAGYGAEAGRGRAGVFAGVGLNTYLLQAPDELARAAGRYQAFIANDKDFVPTRISYKLNLKGPSVSVQTACSSSLVAVHLACRSLLSGECDLALAGGVSVRAPHRVGYRWEQGGIPSPDGHCRAYAADAQGTVFGNGAGIVVLKRLAEARAAGDRVLAVIRGSAINNDGAGKIGYTAPSVDGQAEVIATALAAAGVDPATIGYVEGHGTGTELGDPIEVAALAQALGGRRGTPCALGSVKANIGHLDTAAGMAGLIKAVLAVRHGEIPPSLHATEPNPRIGWEQTPLRVATELLPWPGREEGGAPRRAGVSSFGIGGTNAHVVIEEAPPEPAPAPPRHGSQLLVLSARAPEALAAATERLAAHLETVGGEVSSLDEEDVARSAGLANFADIAFTLQAGRKAFAHRRMVVAGSAREAAALLAAVDRERVHDGLHREDAPDRPMAFLFSGQGSQYPGMAAGLYRTEPVYQAELDRCAEILRPLLGLDLRALINPPTADRSVDREEAGRRLARTEIAQPALFAVEWALARLWLSRGVRPRAMLGHSLGEVVAACLAGVFTLEDALAVVAERGRLMGELPGGAMIAVPLPEAEVLRLLREHGPGLSLAAVNAPELCAVSGPEPEIEALARHLAGRGLDARRLHTSHAFHSAMMEPARAPFAARLLRVELRPPQLPFISNLTGTWITAAEATDPAYWGEHLLRPVRFAAGLRTLLEDEAALLLEVGPGNTLANLARRQAGPGGRVLASVRHPQEPTEDGAFFQQTLGRLWLAGVPVDFATGWEGEGRRRVALPTYPFQRRRYWIAGGRRAEQAAVTSREGVRGNVADWFYTPLWKQAVPLAELAALPGRWLLLPDQAGLAERLAAELARSGAQVEVATSHEDMEAGLAGSGAGSHRTATGPEGPAGPFHGIADLRGVGPRANLESELERGFSGLLRLAQAIGRRTGAGPLRLAVVTSDLHRVAGVGGGVPERAAALGLLRVIPQEMSGVEAQAVDVALTEGLADDWAEVAAGLARELLAPSQGAGLPLDLMALRGGERWMQALEPIRLPAGASPWRERGTYLITGGFGGVGLLVAEHLARTVRARLVLVGRRAGDAARLRALEEMGAEVLALQADVTDEAALRKAVAAARTRFGPLHGVVHAAGVPGGGVILGRPREAAAAVLAPKVRGTLALASALAGEELDYLLLCSSLNGLIGGFGQADYAAANAFLDAFATEAGRYSRTRVVAVAWDRLRGVGMAARGGETGGGHPLLGRRAASTPERAVYRAVWSPADQWVLAEHRVLGTPTAPGTAYLEMARAALADTENLAQHDRVIELREVFFLEPLALADGESREVLTVLDRAAADRADGAAAASVERSAWSFKVLSRTPGAEAWQEHARGAAVSLSAPDRPAASAAAPGTGLAPHRTEATGGADDFITVGSRWRSLGELRAGAGQALATLELSPDLQPDLTWAALHPALLDLATGAARLVRGGAFLPLAYERLRLFAPLPARFQSHLRFREGAETGETLACDITLIGETSETLAEIAGFAMKRVGDEAAAGLRRSSGSQTSPSPYLEKDRDQPSAPPPTDLGDLLLAGIPPAGALEALDRLLAGPRLPRVAVSGEDLESVRRRAAALDVDAIAGRLLADLARLDAPRTAHARPEMANAYAAPTNDLQRTISELWQRVLGLDRVGIHDNFFELGGTSLTGVQVIAELKAALKTEIPAVSLFEAPTVAALARYLQPPQADAAPAFTQARDRAEKKKQALAQPRRPPARHGVR